MNGKYYYWLSYHDAHMDHETCVDEHPFEFMYKLNSSQKMGPIVYYQLTNWKKIEAEEYNLYRELHEKI